MNRSYRKHELLLEELVKKLEATGEYGKIERHLKYSIDGICGEVDVLASHLPDNTYHFYEIKCRLTVGTLAKAERQYQRYYATHRNQRLKGWVVAYNKTAPL